jgi:hypothetical protein
METEMSTVPTMPVALAIVAILVAGDPAFAQAPSLDDVPRDLRDPPRADYDTCHTKLAQLRDALRTRVRQHTDVTCKDVPVNSALAATCADAQKALNGEVRTFRTNLVRFNADLQAAIAASSKLAEVKRRTATTRTALKGIALRGGRLDEDIEQWRRLDEKARQEAQQAALDVVKSHLLINLKEHIESKVAAAVREDDRRTWIFPDFEGSALQRLRAEGLQRLAAARTDRDLVRVLEWMDNGISGALSGADAALRPRTREKWAEFLVTVSQSFVNDPLLARIVADAKAVPVMVYGVGVQYTVKQRLEELRKLGESQYDEAKRYTAVYMQQLDEVKRLEASPELATGKCPVSID